MKYTLTLWKLCTLLSFIFFLRCSFHDETCKRNILNVHTMFTIFHNKSTRLLTSISHLSLSLIPLCIPFSPLSFFSVLFIFPGLRIWPGFFSLSARHTCFYIIYLNKITSLCGETYTHKKLLFLPTASAMQQQMFHRGVKVTYSRSTFIYSDYCVCGLVGVGINKMTKCLVLLNILRAAEILLDTGFQNLTFFLLFCFVL